MPATQPQRRFRQLRDVTAFDRDQCQGLPGAPSVSAMMAPRPAKALNIIAILLASLLLAASHAASGESGNISDTVDANALTQQVMELEKQGRYSEAVPLAQRALALYDKVLGHDHPDVATALYNLAELYRREARYVDAEPLFQRSIAIGEKALGSDHPHVAFSLNRLALLYYAQGRYTDAEPVLKRSLAIYEKVFGPDHQYVVSALNGLASLYDAEGLYADAEPLLKRSLTTREKVLGPDHPDVAATLNDLAEVYRKLARYTDAEPLQKRSLAIRENVLGPDHSDVAASLNNLAYLYLVQRRLVDAEPLYKRSLAIWEKALGPDHPHVATSLNSLATLYLAQGRYVDALSVVKRTITQNSPRKSVALAVLYRSQLQNIITPIQALNLSYNVLQHSASSAAGEAISKLAARLAAGSNDLAQFVRKDQDLTAEAIALDNAIIGTVSKPPAERNATAEEQIRKRIDEIKSESDKLQDIFNRRFPDYVALSKPQPLSVEQTQTLLADDEALIVVDLDENSYVWVITKNRAVWKALSLISAEDASKADVPADVEKGGAALLALSR